jgi:hypothetical protein
MTWNERVDRRLETGMELLADPQFPDYLDEVQTVTSRKRQRPAWTFPERWIPMVDVARQPVIAPALPWRWIALAIALLLIAAVAFAIVGSRPKVPPPLGPARNGLLAYDNGNGISLMDPLTGVSQVCAGNHRRGSRSDLVAGRDPALVRPARERRRDRRVRPARWR